MKIKKDKSGNTALMRRILRLLLANPAGFKSPDMAKELMVTGSQVTDEIMDLFRAERVTRTMDPKGGWPTWTIREDKS